MFARSSANAFLILFFLIWSAVVAVLFLARHPEIIVWGLVVWLLLCVAVGVIVAVAARRGGG